MTSFVKTKGTFLVDCKDQEGSTRTMLRYNSLNHFMSPLLFIIFANEWRMLAIAALLLLFILLTFLSFANEPYLHKYIQP
jgi:hypothetical protein